jgi:DNA replication initiation complex subunit (GINS family)
LQISKTEVNDLINENDKRVLIAAKDVNTTPTTKDKVLINNIVHQIITVDTTEAAGLAITFTLIVRS